MASFRTKDLRSKSDIQGLENKEKNDTAKKEQVSEKKTRNIEKLKKLSKELTANLPQEEKARLQRQLDAAYVKGVEDFKKSALEVKNKMNTETKVSNEFKKASQQERIDAGKIDQVKKDSYSPAFANELASMKKNVTEVSQDLQRSSTGLERDAEKTRKMMLEKINKVVKSRPVLK